MTASVTTPPIFTLTGNLLAERTLDFPAWSAGKTQRATAQSFQVGGKGINVSKMLARLGTPTTALCFPGGASGAECLAWLRYRQLSVHPFPTQKATRTGLVVRTPGQKETTFLGPDSPADSVALQACADYLDALPDGTHVAFCGSFPGWESSDAAPVRDALETLVARAHVYADTYGPPLAWFVERPAALIKINRDEFDLLFPESQRARPALDSLAEVRERWPVRRWIVTDGPGPVCFTGRDVGETSPTALTPPLVTEVSATGSGDVLFACVLHALAIRGLPLREAVRYALPFASANAAHPEIAEFDMNQVPESRSFPTP